MIRIEKINAKNIWDILKLHVSKEQESFVAPNDLSIIEAYIDNCKYQPFSNNKIIVDKDQLEDMLSELRLKTPDEIKKYQKILNNKEESEEK